MEVVWFIIAAGLILLSFFIGLFMGKSMHEVKYDGQLCIGMKEDREQFQFIFETDLEELKKQKVLVMEIISS